MLIGLANSAAHDDVTDQDVSRVEQIVTSFSEHYGVSPPSTLLPGAISPADVADRNASSEYAVDSLNDGDEEAYEHLVDRLSDRPLNERGHSGTRGDRPGAPKTHQSRGIRPSASSDRAARVAGLRVQRMSQRMSGAQHGPWRWFGRELPSKAKPAGIGLLIVAVITAAGVLVHLHGVAALLALPFIVVLAVVSAALALYLSLWIVAGGGLTWAIYLFTQGDNLDAVLFLWISVIAGAALFWLHEEVLG
jgi:hypothetical protein